MAMLATNGIIAGCSQSNAFARAFLHHILEHMCTARINHDEKVLFRQFVDDLRQSHRAPTPEALQTSVSKASGTLSSMLIGAGCKISKKSVILTNAPEVAKAVKDRLALRGILITHVKAAKDLGVVSTAGVRRYSLFLRERLSKARNRSEKIRSLVKVDGNAKRLFTTGAYPQGTYGAVAQGYDPTTITALVRMAHQCVSSDAGGQCATTNIVLTLGMRNHPSFKCPVEQVQSWFDVFTAPNIDMVEVAKAFFVIKQELLANQRTMWQRVKGPMGAIIATLVRYG